MTVKIALFQNLVLLSSCCVLGCADKVQEYVLGLTQFSAKSLTPFCIETSRGALIFGVEKPTHTDPIESKNNLVKYRYS